MFTDLYELLEISPNANSETIERIFRYFAMRYHPDNQETGDLARFSEIVDAHNTLRDPVKRAAYDIEYQARSDLRRELVKEASNSTIIEGDVVIQARLSRFFTRNADKRLTILALAIPSLKLYMAARANTWSSISGI